MRKTIISIIIWFSATMLGYCQLNQYGIPIIKNFKPRDYEASPRNHAIVQNQNGIVFFGNEGYVLEYDGVEWRKIEVAKDKTILGLDIDSLGTVYVNAGNEFGFLIPGCKGQLLYESLSKNLKDQDIAMEGIGNVFVAKDGVYFQSYSYLYKYENYGLKSPGATENFSISESAPKVWEASTSFSNSFLLDKEKVFVQQVDTGLYLLENNKLIQLTNSAKFRKRQTIAILPYARKQIFLGTRKSGLFYYTHKRGFGHYLSESSDELDKISLLKAIALPDVYVLATINKGMLIIQRERYGKKSKILEQYDKHTGLSTEYVTCLYNNPSYAPNLLWFTTRFGISKVDINSPLRKQYQASDLKDVITGIKKINDTIFVKTFGEMHSLSQNHETGQYSFRKIKNIYSNTGWMVFPVLKTEMVKNVKYIKSGKKGLKKIFKRKKKQNRRVVTYETSENVMDVLLAGNRQGVWMIDEGIAKEIKSTYKFTSDKKIVEQKRFNELDYRTNVLYRLKKDTSKVMLGLTDGMSVISYQHNSWINEGRVYGIDKPVEGIIEDNKGRLWLNLQDGELSILTFLADSNTTIKYTPRRGQKPIEFNILNTDSIKIAKYSFENGLPKLYQDAFFNYRNEMILLTQKGLYHFNDNTKQFVPFEGFGKDFCDGTVKVLNIKEDYHKNLWLRCENAFRSWIEQLKPDETGNYSIRKDYSRIFPEMTWQTIYPDSNYLWMSGSEGLFTYDLDAEKDTTINFTTLIRQVTLNNDSVVFSGTICNFDKQSNLISILNNQEKDTLLLLDYAHNDIRFNYAAPYFLGGKNIQYQFMLEGQDNDWSVWSIKTEKEYTNLSAGKYTFRVRARNIFGNISNEATYKIRILAPWYEATWVYITAGTLIVLLIVTIVLLYSRRLRRRNRELDRLVKQRTKELEKQKEEVLEKNKILETANEEIKQKNIMLESQQNEIVEKNHKLEEQHGEILTQNETLQEQKLEIEDQTQKLKLQANALQVSNNQIKQAYENIKLLSEFGQKITSTLNLDAINAMIHDYVTSLMDAPVFGIGIYNPVLNIIDFERLIVEGQDAKAFYHDINETDSLAIWCYKNQKEVFINDISSEYQKYISSLNQTGASEGVKSVIMLPLIVENKPVGVITAQSYKANAYTKNELTNLQTLASYISIALDNASAYRIVRNQNEHITGSIRYAQSIQEAILPTPDEINPKFETFILYKPKDVVSGDFYWYATIPSDGVHSEKFFMAAIDCTGHGVPGAFMSVLGITLLNEIVIQKQIHETNWVLELLNQGIQKSLKQQQTKNTDGMDVCLCCIDEISEKEARVTFTGAKRNLYCYKKSENEIITLKGDRKPIGGIWSKATKLKFTAQELTIGRGDVLYLTSDGYVDQNSPINRERFGRMRFLDNLKKIGKLALSEQQKHLEKVLKQHMQQEEQRDDITVIGVRLDG